jgi:hypothetical protein
MTATYAGVNPKHQLPIGMDYMSDAPALPHGSGVDDRLMDNYQISADADTVFGACTH